MAAKLWKYEEDCARQEVLINVTASEGKPPAPQWAHLARKVIRDLRRAKSASTPLALHFIGVSATEMLENRHDNAKLCLLTAQSLADRALLAHMKHLFMRVFSSPQVKSSAHFLEMVRQAVQAISGKLTGLPEGESVVNVGPGMKALVVKKSFGKPKKGKCKKAVSVLHGDPRLN